MLEISEILYRWVKGFRIKEISKWGKPNELSKSAKCALGLDKHSF